MLVIAAFLFCRTWLIAAKCTGCGACAVKCPTGTLESRDKGRFRFFTYSTSQCIGCGTCIATCPEDAAELHHEISLKGFFRGLAKQEIGSVELKVCEKCGCFFGPTLQLEQIEGMMADRKMEISALKYCDKCRRRLLLNHSSAVSHN